MKQFTAEEMLTRWEWRREIKNLMGRYSTAYTSMHQADNYINYFSKRPDVCLAVNSGYYIGAAAVAGYYEGLRQEITLSSRLIQKKYPADLGDLSDEEVYGVGLMVYKPVDTQVIEIASDGETAKGLWAVRGNYSKLTSCGPVGFWNYGWMAADFVREEDGWKIWHLQMLDEIDHQEGCKWYGEPEHFPEVPEFAEMKDFKMPEPTIKTVVRECYHGNRPFTPCPEVPVPYDTFADTFSYGL